VLVDLNMFIDRCNFKLNKSYKFVLFLFLYISHIVSLIQYA
jgi:hypothetical protein